MASVILKTAGAAIGNALIPGIGGALFGAIGGGLGNIVDSQLGLTATIKGPRLENLSVQDSRYGAGIPIVYGSARVAGNVIWSTDLIETQHTGSSGGKGGGSGVTTKTYTYSVHCAVGICAGPIAGINTIWADSTIIYQDGVWTSGICDGATIYTGSDDQEPNSFMQSILGTDNVPSYRGLAYIVFDNLQLDTFGNRLPNLTFEVAADNATTNPSCPGDVAEAPISQLTAAVINGTMAPIVLQKAGSAAQKVLIGGFAPSGSTATFIASEYDVTGNTPVQLTSAVSDSFAIYSPPSDSSWALSPDGRFIALYIQSSLTLSHSFCIYDTQTRSFGPVLSATLAQSSSYKQIAWVDAQHFVIDNVVGGIRGLHAFARAGMTIIDLGFTGLWGSNSGTATKPFYGAQFTPYADGLLAYNLLTGTATLRARTIAWRNNQLALGAAYDVATLNLWNGSGPHARFLKTANDEWTVVYGTVLFFCALSFEPSASSAVITRPWQKFTQNFGTGTVNIPAFFGDRLLIVQEGLYSDSYLISEVRLDDGGFTLSIDATPVSGIPNDYDIFCAIRLDGSRLLFMAMGGASYSFRQIAIIERNASGSVAAVMADILKRAGYAESDVDVSALADTPIKGYILQDPMSARNAIEPLQTFAPFDLIETSGQLKAVRRGGAAAMTVAENEWRAAAEDKDQPPGLLIARAQETELPREVAVDTIDPSRNFEVNCQRARRLAAFARGVQKIALPIVCTAETAKQIAETKLYTAWAERELIKLSVSRAYFALDPADVVNLGNDTLLRIASITQSGGLLRLEGFASFASSLSSDAVADGGLGETGYEKEIVPSVLYLMDIPLLQSTGDQPGLYVAATGLPGWKGASVFRSGDGISYSSIGTLAEAAVAGMATTALPAGSAFYMDNANAVNVQVTQGILSSCSEIDLMNGANAALLGDEIIQFQTATLIGPGLYTLSRLLRGRRGTEDAAGTHAIGENFVLLQSGTVVFLPDTLSDRNKAFTFRALSAGQNLNDAHDYTFTYGMKTLCPFSPAYVKGTRSLGTSGDLTLTWVRRARTDAEWADTIDVPLDETQELYEADIMDGTAIKRAFTGLTLPSLTYTADQQTTDWGGSVPSSFTVKIYQVSARYGNGNAATAFI